MYAIVLSQGHLQPMLQHYKGSKKQKMEALYRAWNREVFEKGSDRIADKLAEMSEDEITKVLSWHA